MFPLSYQDILYLGFKKQTQKTSYMLVQSKKNPAKAGS